jgi:hypothetical protein
MKMRLQYDSRTGSFYQDRYRPLPRDHALRRLKVGESLDLPISKAAAKVWLADLTKETGRAYLWQPTGNGVRVTRHG